MTLHLSTQDKKGDNVVENFLLVILYIIDEQITISVHTIMCIIIIKYCQQPRNGSTALLLPDLHKYVHTG